MQNSLDLKVAQLEKTIDLLRSCEPDYKETAGMIVGNDRIKDAKWLSRDELIEREQKRLEHFQGMQRLLDENSRGLE
ncbi:MAG: hypothetical protein I8H94_02770 [Rhodobacteraceae bacterium]|nr:hypothetical protein [Paracoccaceae bacterium]